MLLKNNMQRMSGQRKLHAQLTAVSALLALVLLAGRQLLLLRLVVVIIVALLLLLLLWVLTLVLLLLLEAFHLAKLGSPILEPNLEKKMNITLTDGFQFSITEQSAAAVRDTTFPFYLRG